MNAKTPKRPVEFTTADLVAMAARLYETLALSAAAAGKRPDYHAKKALAIAVSFQEAVTADTFTATAAERFKEIE